ncbi:MAG: NUDIX domain-containing protein [Candidatus Saccharibacteria bacterium]
MARRISVRGIVLHEGRLLCVRLKKYKAHLEQDNSYWCLPGGGLDDGESLLDGVKREMLEETGVEAHVGDLLYVQQFTHGEIDHLEFFFHITNSEDYLDIDLAKTTHGETEIEEIEFINPADGRRVLPEFLSTENLTKQANGRPTKIVSR